MKTRGLSLLEVLIATTILSLVSLGIMSMTDNGVETKEKIINEDQETLQVEAAFLRIENDFALLYSPLFFDKLPAHKGAPEENRASRDEHPSYYAHHQRFAEVSANGFPIPKMDSEDKTQLMFLTASHKRRVQDTKESKFVWVYYSLRKMKESEDDEGNKRPKGLFELIRRSVIRDLYKNEEIDWEKIKSHVLLRNIKSFHFEFWSDKEKKFEASMRDLPKEQNRLGGVKIKIVWVAQDGAEIEDERVFRILWPFFEEKKQTSDKSGNQNQNQGQGGVLPEGAIPVEEGGPNPNEDMN